MPAGAVTLSQVAARLGPVTAKLCVFGQVGVTGPDLGSSSASSRTERDDACIGGRGLGHSGQFTGASPTATT
jgi:hypothetical protein